MNENNGNNIRSLLFSGQLYFNAQDTINGILRLAEALVERSPESAATVLAIGLHFADIGNDVIDTPGVPDAAQYLTDTKMEEFNAAIQEAHEVRSLFENPTTP